MSRFALLASGAMAMLVACAPAAPAQPTTGSSSQPAQERKAANQVLRVAKVALPGSASWENSNSNNEIYATMFDTLTMYGPDYKVVPAVAEKWEFRPQDKAWRFTIRKDVTFHNGQKVTVDDIVYSANLVVQNKLPQLTLLPTLAGAKKVDESTLDLLSTTPDATLLDGVPWLFIVPAEAHKAAGKDFGTKPIGSGPYEFVEYRPADILTVRLRKEPHAFRKGLPTEIQFKAIPDLAQQLNGLKTGDIDVAQSGFSTDQAEQLKAAGVTVITRLAENNVGIFSQPDMITNKSPIQDKRVRLALNYSLNREQLAKALYKGYAEPVGQLGFPDTTFWDPSVKGFPYDPAQAKKLLAEAGYPNGVKLPGGIDYTPQTATPELVLAVQAAFKEIGVDAEVRSFEFALYLDKLYGRNGQTRGDVFFLTGTNSTPNFTWARGRFDCALQGQAVLFCSPEFNKLFDQAVAEPDRDKRADLMKKANQALRDDVPLVYTVARAAFLVHTPKIKGVEFSTRSVYYYDNVYRIE